jgi:hypothetical protein
MSDGCPRCATLTAVVADAEAGAHEERLAKDAALRQAVSERKRADRLEARLAEHNEEAEDAQVIRDCLKVWEDCCYAGKRKPCVDLNTTRAARVRTALKWSRIGPQDVQDAFRGLGLLPYEGPYGKRAATKKPGHERKSDVEHVLRDVAKLERFRNYYRRVQASSVERKRELYWEAAVCAREHLALFTEDARTERLVTRWRPDADALSPALIDRIVKGLQVGLGTSFTGDLRFVAMIAALAAERAAWDEFAAPMVAQESGRLFPGETPDETPVPRLRLVEGEAA